MASAFLFGVENGKICSLLIDSFVMFAGLCRGPGMRGALEETCEERQRCSSVEKN